MAAPTGTKTCTGPEGGTTASVGDTVTCTLVLTGAATEVPAGATVTVTAVGGNYSVVTATCTVSTGTGACVPIGTVGATSFTFQCVAAPCTQLSIAETLTIGAGTPNTLAQQVTISAPAASFTVTDLVFRIVPPGTTFFVGPGGNDANTCQSRSRPCQTVNRAHEVARDGDTILLLGGTIEVPRTIRLSKKVTVQPDASAKVVLAAAPGITIFEVTAQGGPNLKASIRNLTMGGNFKEGAAEPAIRLLGDSYTEIAANIIGAEDLPVGNGIVLAGSDHPTIRDNTIQGSSRLVFQPLLVVGKTTSGFGIVTAECLGALGPNALVSNSITITNNLFTNQLIAGVWLCSDGAGQHEISQNVFRGNWRGVALKDVTDTHVATNTVIADRNDGIILYGASLRNRIEGNRVESHVAPEAAAIRVGWLADPIVPLDNRVENNQIVRATVGIHVFGARTTHIRGNEIKLAGARTGVLLTTADLAGDPGSQPRDTEISGNIIVFTGPCAAVVGCGIRLVDVTVPVPATDNDWGLLRPSDVEKVIWHRPDDPRLGLVTFMPFRNMVQEPTPTPAPAATPRPVAGGSAATVPAVSGTGSSGAGGGTGSTTGGAAPVTSVSLEPGCAAVTWPGVDGVLVTDAALGISPLPARRTATIWRWDGREWRAWGGSVGAGGPSQVFALRRGDALVVCAAQPATWQIATQLGG